MIEKTLTIIKRDGIENAENMFDRILIDGYKILIIKKMQWTLQEAQAFYAVHKGSGFFKNLTEFMSSGTIIAAILEKENAIEDYRKLMGATNPAKAADGTFRKLYGDPERYAKGEATNAVHGSDSPESADWEIKFIFPGFALLMTDE